jgi:predicted O-methyltransferase YrrM
VSDARWAAVDGWLEATLVGSDPVTDAALAAAAAAGLPAHQVSPLQGRLLELLVRLRGARSIVELGTLGGVSTIWLARALPEGGRLVSVEVDPTAAAVARENLARAGLSDRAEVRVGAAMEVLPTLEGPFDLVFLDADKRSNPEYLEWALRLSAPGTLLVADNVVRGGAVAEPEPPDASAAGARRFLELVGEHPRLVATALQTVGAKGWDGLALALVVDPGDARGAPGASPLDAG